MMSAPPVQAVRPPLVMPVRNVAVAPSAPAVRADRVPPRHAGSVSTPSRQQPCALTLRGSPYPTATRSHQTGRYPLPAGCDTRQPAVKVTVTLSETWPL